MIYILIAAVFSTHASGGGISVNAEFNTLEACQAAAKVIKRQADKDGWTNIPVMVCAAKGGKK